VAEVGRQWLGISFLGLVLSLKLTATLSNGKSDLPATSSAHCQRCMWLVHAATGTPGSKPLQCMRVLRLHAGFLARVVAIF
jgi:hypothetical protein